MTINISSLFEILRENYETGNTECVSIPLGEYELRAKFTDLSDYCGEKDFEQEIEVLFGPPGIEMFISGNAFRKHVRGSGQKLKTSHFTQLRKQIEAYLINNGFEVE